MSAKNNLIADSGFWIALFHEKDAYHSAAVQALDDFADQLLIVTWPVLVETSHLLFQRVGFRAQAKFLQTIQQGGADIFHLDDELNLPRMTALMEKYQNLPMDLTDASLVVLSEALGHGRILSTDQRDFNTYRCKNHEPFENLLIIED